jgi:predicted metal-dependent peptidase
MQELARNDFSFQRPNPRYMDGRVYMPTLKGTTTSDLLFFVDTSGSLSDYQLSMIMGEIRAIIVDFDVRVIVVYWDTGYRGSEIFDATDVLDPTWVMNTSGRGGTRFKDCWEWMDDNLWEMDVEPKGIIFFSDLECRVYPAEDPDLPLLWCQTPDSHGNFEHSWIRHLPDYGKRVLIPVQKEVNCV